MPSPSSRLQRFVRLLPARSALSHHLALSTRIAAIAAAVLCAASASADSVSAAAQVVLRSSSTASTSSSSTSLAFPAPVGVQPGDLMLAALTVRVSGETGVGSPAGWTLIRRDSGSTGGSTSLSQAVYFKFAGASEPSSYRWTFPSPTGASGGILAFSGIHPASPIDAHSGRYRNYPKSLIAPSVTTTAANALVVGLYGNSSSAYHDRAAERDDRADRDSHVGRLVPDEFRGGRIGTGRTWEHGRSNCARQRPRQQRHRAAGRAQAIRDGANAAPSGEHEPSGDLGNRSAGLSADCESRNVDRLRADGVRESVETLR